VSLKELYECADPSFLVFVRATVNRAIERREEAEDG
jgi:hypothetical protein